MLKYEAKSSGTSHGENQFHPYNARTQISQHILTIVHSFYMKKRYGAYLMIIERYFCQILIKTYVVGAH